ncbi:unnamed protein product [Microthlaspi erraticum]|uniref:F-box protein At3g26010-like beta-propeller domain-containing protein n=1 Tax=Microthlaspi erraticum TaxID=1685480 RepID=A0A6D2HIG1_9BRAS|nr:unnamed protein product [Microthlaspi erraticum]
MEIRYYVGNPVLPQWILLPPPPLPTETEESPFVYTFSDSGLVTRKHNNGAILGYKVVRKNSRARPWSFEIFSSDTGKWSVTQVTCPGPHGGFLLNTSNPVSFNGKLHWLDLSRRVIVHDFFSHDKQARAISLPDNLKCLPAFTIKNTPCGKMICTTSQGYFVLIDVGFIKEVNSYNVRVWRLKSDSWSWDHALEINMASVGLGPSCVPMAIDIEVIYLWDLQSKCFVACNLRTLAKSYGARKVGTPVNSNPFETRETVYKEDDFRSEHLSFLSHFVPSLQVLPTTLRKPKMIYI